MNTSRAFTLGTGPMPDLAVLAAALFVLPESERFDFAEAIVSRAQTWRATPAGAAPPDWPAVVRVERDPAIGS